jgi:hypothetical protein
MPDLTFRISQRVETPARALFDIANQRGDKELASGLIEVLRAVEADGDELQAKAGRIEHEYNFRRTWGAVIAS